MSKLGKKPIPIPKDTKVKVEGGKLILTGPKGSKELSINDKIFAASLVDTNNLNIIVNDFGKELNNGAYLNSLRRTRIGNFHINRALTLEELLNKK